MDKMKNRSSFLFRSWNDEGMRALCACIEHGGRQDPVLPPCSDAKTMVKEHDAGTVPSRTDGAASSTSNPFPFRPKNVADNVLNVNVNKQSFWELLLLLISEIYLYK